MLLLVALFCSASLSPHSALMFVAKCDMLNIWFNTGMVDALASKTMAWEKERGIEFTYDGVSIQFISLRYLGTC